MYYYFSNPRSITGTVFKEKDFDLLDVCNELITETKSSPELKKLAEIKLATSYYSLLGRYIMYPHSVISDLDNKILFLHEQLRRNYFIIMKSHTKFKKKCLITVVALINPKFLKQIINVLKR